MAHQTPIDGRLGRMSDAGLMERVGEHKDPRAFEVLYTRYRPLALTCARRTVFDPNLAADAVQAAFLDVWRSAANYSPERASVRTWIAVVTSNRAIDMRRRLQTQQRVEDAVMGEPVRTGGDATLDGAVDHELGAHLRGQLNSLPARQREVLELAYYEDLSHREIANRLHIPLGTVKGRVRLALTRMRAPAGVRSGRSSSDG